MQNYIGTRRLNLIDELSIVEFLRVPVAGR